MKKFYLIILIIFVIIAGALVYLLMFQKAATPVNNNNNQENLNTNQTGIANPASVNCRNKGYKSEIITSSDGSQYGVCIFSDKSQCEEWAYFRNECQIGQNKPGQVGENSGCVKAGCSGELCVKEGETDNTATICVYQSYYECLGLTTCQRLPDNTCGWVQTDEYKNCVNEKKNL